MYPAIEEFLHYAGLTGLEADSRGAVSFRLQSGPTVSIEPGATGGHLMLSIFHPCPWNLQEAGLRALRLVHYRESMRPMAAGIYHDRLVLSTRLPAERQAPPEIERALMDLIRHAQQCDRPDTADNAATARTEEMHR